ncbi:flavin reductase family protein [Alcaligenaceae bacterium]|nr:flavin reductase family protein [Alcaligenaceae bacterium]
MSDMHFYEPSQGHRLPHCPLKAIVAPRPIGWISTVDVQGKVNLAPYSFFNFVCEAPPILYFSSTGWKDSAQNVKDTGEFVANLATRPLAEAMNISSAMVPPEVDEMQLAGLASAPSRLVKPPRVAQAPAAFECKLISITQIRDLDDKPSDSFMVMGQVVGVHINQDFLRDGLFDTAAARTIARCGYRGYYAEVAEMFEMMRPSETSAVEKGAA